MPGPWITDDYLRNLVAKSLKKDVADLADYWDEFVTSANTDAVADINSILQGKGFTPDQIDAWDNRVTYNRDIALYLALVKGGALAEYDQTTVDKLDRRKMLTDAGGIMINGAIVLPADATTGAGAEGGMMNDDYRVNHVPSLFPPYRRFPTRPI